MDRNREIIENQINGNLSTFREQVKRLSKRNLLILLCDIDLLELPDVKEAVYRTYNV